MKTFCAVDDATLVKVIGQAKRRIVFIAPGLNVKVAEAMGKRFHAIDKLEAIDGSLPVIEGTRAKLQTLIHTYLGDWITQQRRAVDAGEGDAALRLARAQALNEKLAAILEGEKPYDIFVRWKPPHLQPIGWEPDLNDGVRMNIRPFVQAEVLRIPGRQLGIKWEPDRGKDVPWAPWFKLGPTYGEPEGTRVNDHHLSLADKQSARAKVSGSTVSGGKKS